MAWNRIATAGLRRPRPGRRRESAANYHRRWRYGKVPGKGL